MSDPLIGARLGNYQIESSLGRGGMARVYRAYDVTLRRMVALKVIEPDLRDLGMYSQRFEREAQAIAALEHPNIVHVYYFGEADGLYYLAMKFIEGVELRTLMDLYQDNKQSLPSTDLLRIFESVGNALDYAHGQGVIHRDVKPSNIMIDRNGQAYVTDFGLALNVSQGTVGEVFGTPHYIAPEQARSSANAVPQSDFYSLGVILYELFTGVVPFDDPVPTAIALQHIMKEPTPPHVLNPNLAPSMEMVILKAMAKNAEERFQSGEALNQALRRALRGMSGAAREGPPVIERVSTILAEKPPPDAKAAFSGSTPGFGDDDSEIFTTRPSEAQKPRRGVRLAATAVVFAILLTLAGLAVQQFGLLPTPNSPGVVDVPSETPTVATPPTVSPSPLPTATSTATTQASDTPAVTQPPTVDTTSTFAFATLAANWQTQTVQACDYNYEIVSQEPTEEEQDVRADTDFTRTIIVRNTGNCFWERNWILTWVEGESFDANPRIPFNQRVDVGEEFEIVFEGHTPSAGGGLLTGSWELRTPGQIPIGARLPINVRVFGGRIGG